jgi:hypothetical protein
LLAATRPEGRVRPAASGLLTCLLAGWLAPFASENKRIFNFNGKMLTFNFDPGIFNSEATGNSVVFSYQNLFLSREIQGKAEILINILLET